MMTIKWGTAQTSIVISQPVYLAVGFDAAPQLQASEGCLSALCVGLDTCDDSPPDAILGFTVSCASLIVTGRMFNRDVSELGFSKNKEFPSHTQVEATIGQAKCAIGSAPGATM
jgi:hypothetical protein